MVVIRGGPSTVAKLRTHSRRTQTYYELDGQPLFGVSVFCALDERGAASLDGLLASRMVSYPIVHLPTAGALLDAGFELLPSFGRPHYTLRLATVDEPEIERLLDALGPPQPTRIMGARGAKEVTGRDHRGHHL